MKSQLSLEFYNSIVLVSFAIALLIPIFSFLQSSIGLENDLEAVQSFSSKISTILYQVNLEDGLEMRLIIPKKLGSRDFNLSFKQGQNFGIIVGNGILYSFPCPPNVNNTTIVPGEYIVKNVGGVIVFYESTSI